MNHWSWAREAFFGGYVATLGLAAIVKTAFSWRDRTLFKLGEALQVLTLFCATLLGPVYGSRTAARLIDHDLVGHPSATVYVRELLLILGASAAHLYMAGWGRRQPLRDSLAIGATAVAMATWLTVIYLNVTAQGHSFGIRAAHDRPDIAIYYLAFYVYVGYTATRLLVLGMKALPLIDPAEEAVVMGMRAITIAGGTCILLPATHLAALGLLVIGSGAGADVLLGVGTVVYVLANVFYVLGNAYPRPAIAWAKRRSRRPVSASA